MALELDTRQRAMLQEMGVRAWLPDQTVAMLAPEPAPIAGAVRAPVAGLPSAAVHTARSPQAAPAVPAMPEARLRTPDPASPAHAPASASAPSEGAHAAPMDWPALAEAVQSCQACTRCAGRSHTTLLAPASERAHCDWMVLGDPPDEDEDRAGAPFAGQDGVLLAAMLRALGLQRANPVPGGAPAGPGLADAAGTSRQRAYVSNVLKCRPAHGAMAQAAELAQCSAWLQHEIALVQPKVIVAMGRFANQLLLGQTPELAALPLGKLRGTVHRYQGIAVVVSYPPKLLLRTSADKAKAWADLCLAAATLEAAG